MFKPKTAISRVCGLHGLIRPSAPAAAGLVLLSSLAVAQPAGPPPGAAPVAPGGDLTVNAKNLLTPLPKPSAESLKSYPLSTDPRNFEGIWLSEGGPGGGGFFGRGAQPPYTEKAKQSVAQMQQRQQAADAQGKVLLGDSGRCRPGAGMSIGADLFPAEIVQSSDKVVILNEEHRTRWVIHLNAEHPKNLQPNYFGHSVGRWEGDTLVIDTVGLRTAEGGMNMRSDQARIVSRLRKIDGQRIELTSITHDSEIYTQPFEGRTRVSFYNPEVAMLEFQCEENMEGAREGMVEG